MPSLTSQNQRKEARIGRRVVRDRRFRKGLAKASFFWFFHVYFARYVRYPTADFQRQMCRDLQDPSITFLEILAFRGSAKSTLVRAYVIWAIISGESRYAVLIGDTEKQANRYLGNIRRELEDNELLNGDFGPFKPAIPGNDEWQKTSIVIPKYDARIEAATNGQNIRGLSHGNRRPDLIAIDDVEDLKKVRFKENRDQLYDWFKADVMQVGDHGTKFVLIGNLLHSDGIMRRIEAELADSKIRGAYRAYEILDSDGLPMWPGKHPDQASLDEERSRLGEKTWQRECRLKVVPEEGQVIHEEWIRRFKTIPKDFQELGSGAGVDLAISRKASADCTAIVPGVSGLLKGKPKIYIGRRIVNEHLSLPETVDKCLALAQLKPGIRFFVESVGFQQAAIDEMRAKWLSVDGIHPMTDKRARLEAVASYVRDGTVEFYDGPETADLITQLVYFGSEQYDDLADAFAYLIMGLLRTAISSKTIVWV
jgi:predicted phage terminase large subunit-like protein